MIPTGDGCCRCGIFVSFSFLVAVVTAAVVAKSWPMLTFSLKRDTSKRNQKKENMKMFKCF